MDINIGTSGYTYRFWGPCNVDKNLKTHPYYPTTNSKKWLDKYSTDLKSVEINSTRYSKLKPETCSKWAKETPDNFTFTIKAPTYITHYKKLNDFQEWWEEFQPCIESLGKKFKCILFQFDPKFKCSVKNIQKIEHIKTVIPKDIKCAFEFRDLEWYSTLLSEKIFIDNFTQVILIVPEIRQFKVNFGNLPGGIHIGIVNTKFIYFRFHGTYDYSCGTYGEKLNAYVEILESMRTESTKTICAYFNNTDTWTLLPFLNIEGDFSNGVPFDKTYYPSAIYDSLYFRNSLNLVKN